jgi:peroxiredoxin
MLRLSSYFAFSLLLVLLSAVAVSAREVEPLAIGAAAPEFALPGVDGKTYRLQDFQDAKVLMIVFTCNHCPTAQAYEERIMQMHRDYRDRGVALVAISPNDPVAVRLDELGYSDLGDSFEDMKIRAKDRGFAFPYLYDGETQDTSAAYGALATPHVFIFDQDRKLRYAGRIDDGEVKEPKSHDARNALDALLAGKPVPVETTRVFGCSTKWADKRDSARQSLEKWNAEPVEVKPIGPEELNRLIHSPGPNYRLINVWATWCVPCVEELPKLVEINRMYRGRKFQVITVSADERENQAAVLETLKKHHVSTSNYLFNSDSRDALFDSVDPQWKGAFPYTILVSPAGEVVYRKHDAFDPAELKKVIVEHLGRTYASR